MEMLMPRSRFRPRFPALALGVTLVLGFASAAAVAQTGVAQIEADGMPLRLVYPTAAAARPMASGPFNLSVAPAAPPLPGTRRVVLMSHGTGGNPLAEHALAARLAAAGFVVAQLLHRGDNNADVTAAGPESWPHRPREASAALDALAAHPDWGPRLRLDRVGVHGTSAGAITAMTLVGAEWSLRDLIRHCLAAGEADLGFCYNGLPDEAARAARRARFESARNVPDFMLGRENNARHGGRDPRIVVVAVSTPVGAIFRADSLAQVAVPVGVVRAEADRLTPNAFHADRILRHCGACKPLAVMAGAGHMDAMSPWPSSVAKAVAERHPVGGRPEPGFDPAERNAAQAAIVQHFVRHLAP
ncbi:MAG: hypothetical protein INF89_16460 [Roseomonas sp.]|nr:hypothetical protein [Roseomonas sp.]